jgi:hypothetical protein
MDWEAIRVMGSIFLTVLLLVAGVAYLGTCNDDRGCQYICEGNGDENAYRWNAGCWCRDAEGLYNPKDSRGGRRD